MRFRKRFSKQKRERILFCSTEIEFVFLYHARPNFAKRNQRSKWKIPPQTPPFPFATSEFKKDEPSVLPNPSPKKYFEQTQFPISPRHTARILGGQNPERKTPFPFSKEISPPPNQK